MSFGRRLQVLMQREMNAAPSFVVVAIQDDNTSLPNRGHEPAHKRQLPMTSPFGQIQEGSHSLTTTERRRVRHVGCSPPRATPHIQPTFNQHLVSRGCPFLVFAQLERDLPLLNTSISTLTTTLILGSDRRKLAAAHANLSSALRSCFKNLLGTSGSSLL